MENQTEKRTLSSESEDGTSVKRARQSQETSAPSSSSIDQEQERKTDTGEKCLQKLCKQLIVYFQSLNDRLKVK